MKLATMSGASIATLAAHLLLAGQALSAETPPVDEVKGHCHGANACKGKSACMTGKSACGGQNSCKGQGFVELTEAECAKIEGARFEKVEASKK